MPLVAVITTPHPGWVTLQIDNPPVNLLDHRVYTELADHLERLEASETVRVVVLTSADPEFFSAHFDVNLNPEQNAAASAAYPRIIRALQSPNLVSIVKIRGRARGGGHELALLCDMRFASLESTWIAQPEVSVGLIPGGGALQLLPLTIGRSRALELILAGHNVDGATAERYGLVNRALPDGELDEFVDAIAARIARYDAVALRHAKSAVNRRHLPADEDLATDQFTFAELLESAAVRQKVEFALAAGLQTRSDAELNLGN